MDALLLKVPEAAAQLGISRAKLYELIAAGDLPAVKIGGCRRLRSADLQDYVNRLGTPDQPGVDRASGRTRPDAQLAINDELALFAPGWVGRH